MRRFALKAVLWSFIFFVCQSAQAQIHVSDLFVHEDASGTQTIETVSALADSEFSERSKGFSAGLTRSVHWLRFTAQSPPGESGDWLLELHPSYLDDIRLYERNSQADSTFIERRTGDQLPFSSREVPYRGFAFRIDLKENEARTFYLRLQTTSTSMVLLKIWPVKVFYAALTGEYVLLGAVMGLLVIILVINLIYQLREAETVHLPYTVYIAAVLINSVFVQGLAAQFLLPAQPALVNDLQNVSSFLMTSAAGWLYHRVLLVQPHQRIFWFAYRTLMILPLLMLPAIPMGYFTEAQMVVLAYATFMAPIGLWRSAQLLQNKHAGGKMLVVATMISVTAIAASLLHIQGYFPGNFVVLHAILIGTISNVIALHLVIGARSRAQKAVHQLMVTEARELKYKVEQEMQARKEQAHFISMITHEIKTPLAGVVSASESLEILSNNASPEIFSRIERIRRNAQRIDSIFSRYLQIDQLDQARLHPRFSEQSLHKVLSMAVQQFAGATQRLRVQPGADAPLVCDPDLLATAILNLLDNAMKYSPSHEEVSLASYIESDQYIIEVVDRGPGVPSEMRESIFDRYVRSPKHANMPGTGVGLSLVRSIARIHHGSVEALEGDGGGAKFRLALPRAGVFNQHQNVRN